MSREAPACTAALLFHASRCPHLWQLKETDAARSFRHQCSGASPWSHKTPWRCLMCLCQPSAQGVLVLFSGSLLERPTHERNHQESWFTQIPASYSVVLTHDGRGVRVGDTLRARRAMCHTLRSFSARQRFGSVRRRMRWAPLRGTYFPIGVYMALLNALRNTRASSGTP